MFIEFNEVINKGKNVNTTPTSFVKNDSDSNSPPRDNICQNLDRGWGSNWSVLFSPVGPWYQPCFHSLRRMEKLYDTCIRKNSCVTLKNKQKQDFHLFQIGDTCSKLPVMVINFKACNLLHCDSKK